MSYGPPPSLSPKSKAPSTQESIKKWDKEAEDRLNAVNFSIEYWEADNKLKNLPVNDATKVFELRSKMEYYEGMIEQTGQKQYTQGKSLEQLKLLKEDLVKQRKQSETCVIM